MTRQELGKVLLRLVARGVRYRYLKATGKPGPLEALSLEVTRRCIARCVMCNIWQTPRELRELEAGDWLELLASPLLADLKELDVTGGEPFLRDDLVQLLLGIGALKTTALSRLRSVALTTNGFLTRKVLADVRAVIGPLERAGVTLVFACGMDAVGDLHDRIRGTSGGWAKLHATLGGLKAIREEHPSLVLGIKTTISRYNVGELAPVCEYADAHGLFAIMSPYILTGNRYANLGREDALAFSSADRETLRRFYESHRLGWSHHRNGLLQMEKPCSAGFNYLFVRSNGDVFPCPIIEAKLGNVRSTPLRDLVGCAAATRFRRRVMEFPECATCTEPGLERYALPFEGFHYLKLYLETGREGFCALHRHLGLDKYLA